MRGLLNLGNSCYFNSTLQCLLQVPQLSNFMILKPFKGTCEFTKEYQKLVKDMWLPKDKSIPENPEKVLKLFKKSFSQFDNFLQQDSQETFLCLLDILDKSLKPFKPVKYPFDHDDQHSFIKELFYSRNIQETICKSETTKTFETNTINMLMVNKNSSLEELIKVSQDWNTLQNFKDSKNIVHNVAVTRTLFWYTPFIMVFSMKMYCGKKKVDIQETIDLKEFIHTDSPYKDNTEYSLFACCKHSGSNQGGHYVAFTKHKDVWYYKDDEKTSKIDNVPLSDTYYLLLYKRANSSI